MWADSVPTMYQKFYVLALTYGHPGTRLLASPNNKYCPIQHLTEYVAEPSPHPPMKCSTTSPGDKEGPVLQLGFLHLICPALPEEVCVPLWFAKTVS